MKINLDPLRMENWQIAYEAEKRMKTIFQLAEELGLLKEEIIPYGYYIGKVKYKEVLERLKNKPNGKYINITTITPTPYGEGKTTTTIGLIQGLAKRGKKVTGAIRQPSSGPLFNLKGGATGGGLSQVIPIDKITFGFTGDINAVVNAHNLAMVALTARLQHENNYDDKILAKKGLKRLDIDPKRVEMPWVIDYCAQALRKIIIGLGGKKDGYLMESKFWIAPASEIMTILSLSQSVKELRERIGKIVVAFDKSGNPITAEDLEVAGAMTAWLIDALKPNLVQTIEGQPIFIHTGPFANIAIGQSSILADYLGLKLAEYHITESGFGADIGYEKFWNIKCKISKLKPDATVIVITLKALKYHGGDFDKKVFKSIEKGCENLIHCINIIKKSGINPLVCINKFIDDKKEEISLVKKICEEEKVRIVVSEHWLKGGEGALEFADAVIDICKEDSDFKFLYQDEEPIKSKIEKIAKEIYGAEGVIYLPIAEEKIAVIERDKELKKMPICIAKTHLSLSNDPTKKGVPKNWKFEVKDVLIFRGAKLIVPVAENINLMPGTASDPRFRKIEVDLEKEKIIGFF